MDKRFNKGTNVGKDVIEHSLKTLGCGRSCVADNKGNIICGHDVYDIAKKLNKKIVTIESDGDVLFVIKRVDIDENSTKSKELQLVDNFSQERNLQYDTKCLINEMRQDLSFDPRKWGAYECLVEELDLPKYFKDSVSIQQKEKKETNYIDTQKSLFEFDD